MHVTLFDDTVKNAKVGKRPKRGTKSSIFGASFFVPFLELPNPKMTLSLFVVVVVLSLHHQVNQPTKEPTYPPTNEPNKEANTQASKQPTKQGANQPLHQLTNQPTNEKRKETSWNAHPTHYLHTANPYSARAASPHSHHEVSKYIHSQTILRSGCITSLSL